MTDENQRPKGRPGTADDTRERLVSAAVEVFLERGYSNTRVQDITRAAGFTTGALYAHFKNREEILAVALVREGERLVRNLAHELKNIDIGTDPSIHLVAEGLTDPLHTTDRLMLEALTMATRKDNVRDQMLPAVNLARDTLTEGVKAGLEAGVIPEEPIPRPCRWCSSPCCSAPPWCGPWTFPGPMSRTCSTSSSAPTPFSMTDLDAHRRGHRPQ
ncbi:MAG: TetR/AcrR family transcriptional regulator [Microthrixaceae bacterium]